MNKRAFLYASLLLTVVAWSGKTFSQERVIAEQVVAVVGSSMIMLSDIEEMVLAQEMERKRSGVTSDKDARCEALEGLLLQNMLSSQAKLDSLPENSSGVSEMVEQYTTSLIQNYGSVAALEAAYRKPLYLIKRDIQERYTDMSLAMQMQNSIKDKATITPSEVERFFRTLNRDSLPTIPEQYVYAHIVMYPASTEDAKLRARERLLELRARVINGERFELLARAYSQDDGTRSKGGLIEFADPKGFVTPFGDALKRLKPGQISEVVETEYGFHIIQLIDMADNLYNLRHILIKPEFMPEELADDARVLDSIAVEIRNGNITFEEAAAKYSGDSFSKDKGGLVSNHELVGYSEIRRASTRFFKENLGKDFQYLNQLRPGEVSNSYSTQDGKGNELTKIVMLKEIIPAHRANIKDDYIRIEEVALEDKKNKIYQEWLVKKIRAMYVRIDPRFITCDFEIKEWLK